jgi:hypothetical protein
VLDIKKSDITKGKEEEIDKKNHDKSENWRGALLSSGFFFSLIKETHIPIQSKKLIRHSISSNFEIKL